MKALATLKPVRLELVTSVVEAKEFRDKAAAIQAFFRQQGEGLAAQNEAAEWKLRAERRLGVLLVETVEHGGDRRSRSHDATLKTLPAGITRSQSSRWQLAETVAAEIGSDSEGAP